MKYIPEMFLHEGCTRSVALETVWRAGYKEPHGGRVDARAVVRSHGMLRALVAVSRFTLEMDKTLGTKYLIKI